KAGGSIRITPWRMIHIAKGSEIGRELMFDRDFITSSDDPLLRVVACTGAPGCPQACSETRTFARRIAPWVPRGATAHISGCAKGCAHPGKADFALTATPEGYRGARNATAAEAAAAEAGVALDPHDLETWLNHTAAPEKA
ncbi:MAG: hypothetical protein ACK4GM_16910, partial [Tabrizicola sp.]